MNTTEIRALRAAGEPLHSILCAVIAAGLEFPDAVWRVTRALRLEPDEVQEMEDAYTQGTH